MKRINTCIMYMYSICIFYYISNVTLFKFDYISGRKGIWDMGYGREYALPTAVDCAVFVSQYSAV